jgi:hypothetical protein
MNIIFDSAVAEQLKEKHTILELDTLLQPGMEKPMVLYAVVEAINLAEISTLPFYKGLHQEMITAYKSGEWNRAIEIAESLRGQFSGEIDEFYERVVDFCTEAAKVNKEWDGIMFVVPTEDN